LPIARARLERSGAYILVLLATATLSACGGGGESQAGPTLDDVLASVEDLSGDARTKKLVELADEAGGEMTIYTTSDIDLMAELTDGFEDAYDLDVSVYKTSREGLLTRVAEERKAGFQGADVIESNSINMTTLSEDGAFAQYESPSVSGLVAGSAHGDWIADKVDNMIVAWNTKNVPAGEQPRSREELADPKWKGRISLLPSDADWYHAVWKQWVASGKTPEEANRLFDAIGRNAVVVSGRSLQRQLLISGEVDVAVAQQRHNIQNSIDEGAPLAYEPIIEPVITRPDGIAVSADPPNPAAALLFTDWLLSDGEDVLADYGADVTRKDLLVAADVERLEEDIPGFVADQEEWEARWERVLGLGEQGPESD
jgi:iron(III) transport system substrate-binding protein